MIRRKKIELGIATLVLVLLNSVQSKETCSHRCDAPYGNHQLNYKERTTYSYQFSSDLFFNLPNTKDVKDATQVKATVFITPQNGCGYVLQLQNFQIISASKTYENFVGIEKPVTFQYLNGAVAEEICAEADDPPQSLNVKRAIISHLQLDSKSPQTDFFGLCPTNNVVEKENEDTVVRKMRNLNACDKRERFGQNFVADALRDKSLPLLNSNFESLHRVNDGIVKHANIYEQYVVSPMDNKANATVRSVLQYVGTVAEMKPNLRTTEIKSIIFESIPALLHKSTKNALMKALDKFGTDALAVSNTTAQNFLSLVKIMRDSTKEDLTSVYKLIGNTYFQKIYLDALLRCGTSDSMTTTIELKTGKKLHRSEEEILYQGFAYVRYPTSEIVRAAANLVSDNDVPKEVYPNIGSLVGRYCEQHTCPDDVVSDITTKFVSKLSSPSKTEVVYALKALSNAKHLPEDVARQVFAFAQNPSEHDRLRSAAYDVLAKADCVTDMRNGLIHVLQNTEEDSEIRIKSYLVLAKCPDQHVAEVIETLVNSEPSNQVGGFIASHAKSSRNILSTIDIQKTYPQDPSKYSFTTEIPHNFAGFSGKTGADVIYSQKSFLPRYKKINVTADMFGSSINVCELEMRQENVDRLLEYFIGPVGVYQKEVKKYHGPPPNVDLEVDVSMKLFGTDFLFTSFSEKPLPFMNRMLATLSENAKSKINFELNKQNGVIFIDSQLSYPTSMGFPLRLSVEGVSSVQIHALDDFSEMNNPFGLIPSIDLDVVAGMALDAVVVETGVKVISKVHIAAGFKVITQQDEIKFSLPLEEQEVSISHDIYFNQREFGEPDSMKPVRFSKNEEEIECLEGFADYTGLDLCLRFNAPPPNNNQYLGGSYKAALILKNTDFSHVSLSHRKGSNNDQKISEISAKILGRRLNTKTGAVLEFSKVDGYLARFTAILPKQNASAEVRFANTENEKSFSASVNFGKQKFSAKLGVGMSQKPYKVIYNPLLYVAIPGKDGQQHYPLTTEGSVAIESKDRNLKIALKNLQLILKIDPKTQTYSANGSFEQNKDEYALDLTVSNGDVIIQITDKVRMLKEKFEFRGHVTNNKYPELNLHVNYDCMRTRSRLHNLLEAVHGSDRNSAVQRLMVRNDAYFDSNGRLTKLEDEITYPHGGIFGSSKFERTNTSFDLDVKFQEKANVYGGSIKSNCSQTLLGETRVVLYNGDQEIVATLAHTLEKVKPIFVSSHLYDIHHVEFTFKSPQTDKIYVTGIVGNTPPKIIYSFKIKDTTRKYVDLSISKISSTYNLVMYITDEWDIVARVENKDPIFKGDLVTKVFGNSANLDVFANITAFYHVSNQHTIPPQVSSRGLLFDSRNSLTVNGRSYGKVNITYTEIRDYEKETVVRQLSINTTDIIKNGVRDDLQFKTQSEVGKTNSNKMECGLVYTGHYKEYNVKLIHQRTLTNPNRYVGALTVKAYPKHETDGITLEYIEERSSNSESRNFKIDALNHEEKLFVAVGCDKRGGVNVTGELRTNFVFDTLTANFSTVISSRPYLKVLVKAWAMAKDLEHKLNGEFNEVEKGGKFLVSLTNNYSPSTMLTANYEFKPKNFDINWDLRRGTSTFSNAFITIGENGRREYFLNAKGTYDGHQFTGSTNVMTGYIGTSYNLTSKLLIDDIEHTFDSSLIRDRNKLGFYQRYCGKKNEPCLEINAIHAGMKNSLLLDLRLFGCHKMYMEQASTSNNHTVEVVFDDRAKYATTMLQVRNGIEYSLITPRRHTVLDFQHNSINLSASCDFYPNKLKSNHKTSLSIKCKLESIEAECQVLMTDPNLPRSLMIKAITKDDKEGYKSLTYIFDIFQREKDKIVLETQKTKNRGAYSKSHRIMSEGLDFSCEYVTKFKTHKRLEDGFEYVYGTNIQMGKKAYVNGVVARVFPNEFLFNLTSFNNQVIMLQARRFGSPIKTVVEGDLELVGVAPMYGSLITKNYASLNFTTGFKNHLDKLELAAKLFGGDVMRVQATKNNTVLFTTSLTVKGNHLDFDYRYNASNVHNLVLKPGKQIITQSRLVFENFVKQLRLKDEAHQVRQKVYGAIPDFNNYLNFYLKDKKNFENELATEPALRYLNSLSGHVFEIGYDYADIVTNGTYDAISSYISFYLFEDFEIVSTNIRLSKILEDEVYEQLVQLNQFLGANEKEMRQLGVDFFARVDEVFALLQVIKRSFVEAFRTFKDTEVWLKFSNRLERGPPASPEVIIKYKKIMAELRARTNSVEMIKLLNLLEAYTEKKLLKKYVNNEAAFEEISAAFEDVLLVIYEDDSSSWQILSLLFQVVLLEFQMGYEQRDLISLKLDEARITAAEEFDKLKFPPEFVGVFAKDYVFTFDNNHLTMNTNCKLLLLEDAIDGNFSITADYTYGYATFTFVDKKNQIALFKDGWDVSRNSRDTNAFALNVSERFNQISIKSKYGAQLDCDLSVLTCVVKVSGYYHGRLKGLLGNANRETYDDFMIPNGKIASNPENFVRSYATQQCSVLQTSTNAPTNPHCEEIFSEPTFRLCSKFVDPEPYKKACDESFHIGLTGSEEKISQIFAAICYDRGVHINLHNETNFIL